MRENKTIIRYKKVRNSLYISMVSKGVKPIAILDGPKSGYTLSYLKKNFKPTKKIAGCFVVRFKFIKMPTKKYLVIAYSDKYKKETNRLSKLYPNNKKRRSFDEQVEIGLLLGYDKKLCVEYAKQLKKSGMVI